MRTIIFVGIVLIAGALAGLVNGVVNFIIVEPYLDQAIELENRYLVVDEENKLEFQAEYEGYRMWQKEGQVFASVILGISMGSLFGIVYYLSKERLPGTRYVTKSLILSTIMWLVLFLVPFLKYPATLPGTSDVETLELRTILYLSFVIASGIGAIICYKIITNLKKYGKIAGLACYIALVSILYIAMPDNTTSADIPNELVDNFRIMSIIGVLSFWITNGILLGLLWTKLETDQTIYGSR